MPPSEFIIQKRVEKAQTLLLTTDHSLTYIAEKSGIADVLKKDTTIEGMGRLENMNALLDGIKEFVENDEVEEGVELTNDKSLASYIQNIALHTNQDGR